MDKKNDMTARVHIECTTFSPNFVDKKHLVYREET